VLILPVSRLPSGQGFHSMTVLSAKHPTARPILSAA